VISIIVSPAATSFAAHMNTISFLPGCDQPNYKSSHQERSKCKYEWLNVWTLCSSQLYFEMWKTLLF
jgi:hypothetical protein